MAHQPQCLQASMERVMLVFNGDSRLPKMVAALSKISDEKLQKIWSGWQFLQGDQSLEKDYLVEVFLKHVLVFSPSELLQSALPAGTVRRETYEGSTSSQAYSCHPHQLRRWEHVAAEQAGDGGSVNGGGRVRELHSAICKHQDTADRVYGEDLWMPRFESIGSLASEADVAGAFASVVTSRLDQLANADLSTKSSRMHAAWHLQTPTAIMQRSIVNGASEKQGCGGAIYGQLQAAGTVLAADSSSATANCSAPYGAGRYRLGVVLLLEPKMDHSSHSLPNVADQVGHGAGGEPTEEAAETLAEVEPAPKRQRQQPRCACVGELKIAPKLMEDKGSRPVDLLTAYNDPTHRRHGLVKAVISQIYTYMMAKGTCYGFISCYLATWLVYCPSNDRKLLYLSDAFLATTTASTVPVPGGAARSTAATVYGALAFLQWLALRGASCQQPGEDMAPTGLGPAADGGGDGDGGQHGPFNGDSSTEELDAGGKIGSDEFYSPTTDGETAHKRRELEATEGPWSDSYVQHKLHRPLYAALEPASPLSTQQPLAAAPAAAANTGAVRQRPSRVLLRFQEELSAGSEGLVVAGTCDGVDCVIKLLGPDCSGLAAYEREVAAYAALEGLQGLHVPELLACGDLKWGVRFLAVRRVADGQPLCRLSRPIPAAVAAAALRVLEAVQAACPVFVHGDVRLANMLVIPAGPLPPPLPLAGAADARHVVGFGGSERGGGGGGGQAAGTQLHCMLLDFGRSRLDGDEVQQRLELEQLRQLLAAAQQQQV